jgi:hypothetical protein
MTDGFTADTAKLHRQAGEFPDLASRVGAIHAELRSALAASGDCWGQDAAGTNFAAGHVEPANAVLDRFTALPGQLTEVGDRFTTTARGYQQADAYAVDRLPTQD